VIQQFQVNHHSGKRLVRSINLLQEELQVLKQVNSWQMKLVESYMSVLDDMTYEKNTPSRRALFPHERILLRSCLDHLRTSSEEYDDLLNRCGPLSERTKQSLEINEEDHGKAIMVFTLVTIIFLPLSFVTSFLGMNTSDIRDMSSGQSLFWMIAVPLAAVTMGTAMFIGYNGDELRDTIASIFRTVTGKEDRSTSARGISVAQRKRARQLQGDANGNLDSIADEAEFTNPRLNYWVDGYNRMDYRARQRIKYDPVPPFDAIAIEAPQPRAQFETQAVPYTMAENIPTSRPQRFRSPPPPPRRSQPHGRTTYIGNEIPYIRRARSDEWDYTPAVSRPVPLASEEDTWYVRDHVRQQRRPYAAYNDRLYGEGDDVNVQGYQWMRKDRRRYARRDRDRRDGVAGRTRTIEKTTLRVPDYRV